MIIAEISANHLGSLDRARELIRQAAKVGATAVKFQTYTADTMTLDLPKFAVSDEHELWGGKSLYSLYEEAHTPWIWHKELFALCREYGVIPFSSPFDSTAVDFLESLDTSIYKIASLESGDLPLIRKVARTGKPMIISTGATELSEIHEAVEAAKKEGNLSLTLLVCTSAYPAEAKDAHLARIQTLKAEFGIGIGIGISDHTLGLGVSVAAVALGASVVEKHLTLNRNDGGADAAFSMEPNEFAQLVVECKRACEAVGDSEWRIQPSEQESRRLRRSLYVTTPVKVGEKVSSTNVRAIRPNGGLAPKYYDEVLGKTFKVDCEPGTPLSFDLID
jgi:pseudaminic acid synthase